MEIWKWAENKHCSLKCHIFSCHLPCPANRQVLAVRASPPAPGAATPSVFKLTLAEEYKNRCVKILPQWISGSHRELAVSDAASLNLSLKTWRRHGEAQEETHDKTEKTRTDMRLYQQLRGTEATLRQKESMCMCTCAWWWGDAWYLPCSSVC